MINSTTITPMPIPPMPTTPMPTTPKLPLKLSHKQNTNYFGFFCTFTFFASFSVWSTASRYVPTRETGDRQQLIESVDSELGSVGSELESVNSELEPVGSELESVNSELSSSPSDSKPSSLLNPTLLGRPTDASAR